MVYILNSDFLKLYLKHVSKDIIRPNHLQFAIFLFLISAFDILIQCITVRLASLFGDIQFVVEQHILFQKYIFNNRILGQTQNATTFIPNIF